MSRVKNAYEMEKKDIQNTLDDLTKRFNDLKQTADGILKENNELIFKKDEKFHQFEAQQGLRQKLQTEKEDLHNKINQIVDENNKSTLILDETLPQLDKLKAKQIVVDERLQNMRVENSTLTVLVSELSTKLQDETHEFETRIEEAKKEKTEQIEEISGDLKKEYETRMKEALKELRDIHENQLKVDKEEFKNKYETKLKNLQTILSQERSKNNSCTVDNDENEKKIKITMLKIDELTKSHGNLQKKLDKLSETQEITKDEQEKEIENRDSEIEKLLNTVTKQSEDYQTLQETKNALDMEIAVYRKLMESEEDRLGLQSGEIKDCTFICICLRLVFMCRGPLPASLVSAAP